MKLSWITVPVVLGLALSLAACNPTDAKDLTNDASKLAKSATVAAKNASVAANVNTALSLRKGVHMEGLHIEAKDNVVTIGGHVKTATEKKLILDIARETRGCDKLVDELRVEP